VSIFNIEGKDVTPPVLEPTCQILRVRKRLAALQEVQPAAA
jgi:hypothetical protein